MAHTDFNFVFVFTMVCKSEKGSKFYNVIKFYTFSTILQILNNFIKAYKFYNGLLEWERQQT